MARSTCAQIRKPGFFAKAPYHEPVAEADGRTHVVEFTVPRDPLERLKLGMPGDIRLRGWYVEGAGVDDGRGGRTRALVIMSPGGGGQLTAIQHPADVADHRRPGDAPRDRGARTRTRPPKAWACACWRDHLHALNRAGFDVLAYDRRGEGLSGGFSDTNTLEQSEDIFRVLEQMETGRGMRVLTPRGELLEGAGRGGRLMAGMKARQIPLLLLGYSRGSMATGWAMTKNYAGGCSYDLPTVTCTAPKGFTNIKGAILFASFVSGAGYLPEARDLADRNLFLGGMAADNHVAFYPNSAVLANMHRWPAVFFAKGLWDRAESLEGTVAAYDRVRGLKEIVVVARAALDGDVAAARSSTACATGWWPSRSRRCRAAPAFPARPRGRISRSWWRRALPRGNHLRARAERRECASLPRHRCSLRRRTGTRHRSRRPWPRHPS